MLIVVVVLVSVLSAAGGVAAVYALHGHRAGTPAAMPSPSPSGASSPLGTPGLDSPPPTPARLRDGKALLAQILPAPAGAESFTVKGSTNGVLDLDQYVAIFRSDHQVAAKADLRARGFQVAAERDWQGTDGVEVEILLTQFEDTEGALSYVLNQANSYDRDPKYTASFVIPSATHGEGFEAAGLDAAGNHRATLLAQDGRLKVTIFFYVPGTFDRAGEIALMQRELAFIK
jgi:hypothetical protein